MYSYIWQYLWYICRIDASLLQKMANERSEKADGKKMKEDVKLFSIRFENLVFPSQEFQVRELNTSRVDELYRKFIGSGQKAMAMARDEVGEENFETVSCIVYTNLDPHETLSNGYQKKRHAEDVIGMTDFDKVMLIRKLQATCGEGDHLPEVYRLLNITEVSSYLHINI